MQNPDSYFDAPAAIRIVNLRPINLPNDNLLANLMNGLMGMSRERGSVYELCRVVEALAGL